MLDMFGIRLCMYDMIMILLLFLIGVSLVECKRKGDRRRYIVESLCSTSSKTAKKSVSSKVSVMAKDIGCIFVHTGKTIGYGIKTGMLAASLPYDIYNMPDYNDIDGEPTVDNVKDDNEPTEKEIELEVVANNKRREIESKNITKADLP
jgi:hypothetical protein